MPSRACKFFILILGMWLGLTCFIDFVAVPKAFQIISSRQEAGSLGMIIFHTFNKMEIFFAVCLLGGAWFFRKWVVYKKVFFLGLSFLFTLSLVYNFHMTPTIINSNKEKYELEESDPQYKILDERHQRYHKLFRTTDSAKILILLWIGIAAIRRNDQECNQ